MNKYILKEEYKIKPEDKGKAWELESKFFENDHALLHGKRISPKLANEINELYWKYFRNDHVSFRGSLLEIELEDLKHDGICKGNSNKRPWVQSYMIEWLEGLPEVAEIGLFYGSLTSREAYRELLAKAYQEEHTA